MLHADVKKLGTSPTAAGIAWSAGSRADNTERRRRASVQRARQKKMSHAFVHTVADDDSRVAHAEGQDDQTAQTAAGVLRRAVLWPAARGVRVERALTDNGGCYRSCLWRQQCQDLDVTTSGPGSPGHRPSARSNASTAP